MTPLKGDCLIHLTTPSGIVVGRDESRLDNITAWIMGNLDLAGKAVLDVGSNVGHFPIVYGQMGAKVVAVEPRVEIVDQFQTLLDDHFCGLDVRILCQEMRQVDYAAIGPVEVLSTLGLIYHLNEPWLALEPILKACRPSIWLLESCLWGTTHTSDEGGPEGMATLAYVTERVLRPTAEDVEKGILSLGYKFRRIDLGPTYKSENGSPRGFWLCVPA